MRSMYYLKAKPISFSSKTRNKEKTVEYIVIHNTGNDGDTAKNNVDYFACWNEREAGAHFFIDQAGRIGRSIPMNNIAWAVGDNQKSTKGGASLKNKVTNNNSISIELCDIVNKEPSKEMIEVLLELIDYIVKYCPKVKRIVRHYDVTGKQCPKIFIDDNKWYEFLSKLIICK